MQAENTKLQEELKQKDCEVERLQRLVSLQVPEAVTKEDHHRHDDGAQQEPGYTQQRYIDNLVGEVNRLTPFEKKVKSLERQLKVAEDLNKQAKGLEKQVVEQVTLTSRKEAEIEQLKKMIEGQSEVTLATGASAKDENVAPLREQLSKKDMEISRLKARLKKQDRATASGDEASSPVNPHAVLSTDGPHTADKVATLQTEFDQKLKHRDVLIAKLKKRVNELTELALPTEGGDDMSVEDPTDNKSEKQAEQGMVAASGGVVSEHRLSREQVEELQRAVQDREKRLKTATDQLQKFEKTASDVVMMRQHSKQQSETIVQLKKQLEATGAKVHVHTCTCKHSVQCTFTCSIILL